MPAARPEREQVRVEGGVDLASQALQLKLWQGGGSVLDGGSGVELKVEKGVAYTRRLAGTPGSNADQAGAWEETPDISASFAPGGDALAFLAGIKNVTEVGRVRGRGRGWPRLQPIAAMASRSTAPRWQGTCAIVWRSSSRTAASCRSA